MSRGVAGGIRKTQPKANILNPNAAITRIIFEEGSITASVRRRRAGDALREKYTRLCVPLRRTSATSAVKFQVA